ncbi:LOW QUALITY PROTEIN: methyltransferase N6AMT1 [Menidia menidia]
MSTTYPTPVYSHAGRGDFQDVYEPAEDSFLLLDALEKDADTLRKMSPSVCLEVGSGSGVASAFLASLLGPSTLYLCTDVNPAAARCTMKTASRNGVSLQPVVTDLVGTLFLLLKRTKQTSPTSPFMYFCLLKAQCLLPQLSEKVDILLFNPPYVVTPSEEVGSSGIEAAWAGGERGREVTDRFLPAVTQLLSKRGVFYLIAIAENDPGLNTLALLTQQRFFVRFLYFLFFYRGHHPDPRPAWPEGRVVPVDKS